MLLYQISEELTEHFNELNINISNINLYKINYDTLNKDLKKEIIKKYNITKDTLFPVFLFVNENTFFTQKI